MVTVQSHGINLNYADSQTPIQVYRIRFCKYWTPNCAFNKLPSNFYEMKVLDPIHEEGFEGQSPSWHQRIGLKDERT